MLAKFSLAALFATAAIAAPTSTKPKGMPLSVPLKAEQTGEQWTVEGLIRTCNDADTECVWSYSVNTYKEGTEPYACEYSVYGSPASQTDVVTPIECEVFQITHGWDEDGFTNIVPVHPGTGRRIYAGYEDTVLVSGEVVTPDRTFDVRS